MPRTPIALLLIATLATLPGCLANVNDDLGHKIAGTWIGTFHIDVPDFSEVAYISTFHPDGTAFTTSSRMFGAGDVERVGLSSTHHIQWEPAGQRRIRWRLLHFGYNPDGTLRYITRTSGTIEYDENFETSQGTFDVQVHDPSSILDPLTPNNPRAAPVFTAHGTSKTVRLHIAS